MGNLPTTIETHETAPTGGHMPNKPEPLFVNGHYVYTLTSTGSYELSV